jgi:hypothetical protein
LLFYSLTLGNSHDTTKHFLNNNHSFRHSTLTFVSYALLGNSKRHSPEKFEPKQSIQKVSSKNKGSKISIFSGRSANKNQAIFSLLNAKGPLAISDLQKLLNKQKGLEITYYASLNKRIHALEKNGYLTLTRPTIPTQKGFKAALYEATAKFYLAIFLNGNSHEEILSRITNSHAIILLSDLINATISSKEK